MVELRRLVSNWVAGIARTGFSGCKEGQESKAHVGDIEVSRLMVKIGIRISFMAFSLFSEMIIHKACHVKLGGVSAYSEHTRPMKICKGNPSYIEVH